jgi:ubiquinone biosynthesis protein
VPTVVEALSTQRVLALEMMPGEQVGRSPVLARLAPAQRRRLAGALLEEFLHQLLDDGLFSADPHPGNVLIAEDQTLSQIDFGSVARLSIRQRQALARLLHAVGQQDSEAMAQALAELTTSSQRLDRDGLDAALSAFLGEHLTSGAPASVTALEELLRVLSDFDLQFDGNVAAVFRAFTTLEGTLRVVDPTFNVIHETQQLAPSLVIQHLHNPAQVGSAMARELSTLLPLLARLPRRVDRLAQDLERGHLRLNIRLFDHEADVRLVKTLAARATVGLLSVGIGLVSALLLHADRTAGGGGAPLVPVLGYLGLATATGLGVRVLVSISQERLL